MHSAGRCNRLSHAGMITHCRHSIFLTHCFMEGTMTPSYLTTVHILPSKQGVAQTGRNTTGPPCSRGAIIRLEAA